MTEQVPATHQVFIRGSDGSIELHYFSDGQLAEEFYIQKQEQDLAIILLPLDIACPPGGPWHALTFGGVSNKKSYTGDYDEVADGGLLLGGGI